MHHFKVFFACAAFWTSPVHGHIGLGGASGNAVLRRAGLFVVNPSTVVDHAEARMLTLERYAVVKKVK